MVSLHAANATLDIDMHHLMRHRGIIVFMFVFMCYLMDSLHRYLEPIKAPRLRQLHLLAESVGQVLHDYTVCA